MSSGWVEKVETDSSRAQRIAAPTTILRAVVGSRLHGLGVGDDDRDEMGVCVEGPEYVIGLSRFEQWVFRTKPQGVRSEAGDLDLVVYSLRKFCALAAGGNPSLLALLFAPPAFVVQTTVLGQELQARTDLFASRKAGNAFLGYMKQQRERLVGERGQKRVWRPELVERYGYDTKYAAHIVRLGYQGCEFLSTGRLTLPMPEIERQGVLRVRRGEVGLEVVLRTVDALEQRVRAKMEESSLPPEPDRRAISRWLSSAYLQVWEDGVGKVTRPEGKETPQ